MPVIQDSPAEEITTGFLRVCEELEDARRRLHEHDTVANREAVAACRARADVLLDMYLEVAPAR